MGATGEKPEVTLYWEALDATERPQTVFVHLLDAQGQEVGFGDGEPGGGTLHNRMAQGGVSDRQARD